MGAFCVRPSFELSLKESVEIYAELQIKLFKILYKKERKNAFNNFIGRIAMIKKQKDNLLNFLNGRYWMTSSKIKISRF